ncbi:MAG: YggS family pyridoxal phosphate-dependent enzyme [Candidatus Omnitrophica bacterium]|nr:YggS family pyridoxal phosphate-dependent enzyme [Candidatus Omnitrophota bacterium]
MIKENVQRILKELPGSVELVAAAKERSVAEIKEALEAGVKIIGENYIKEAQEKFDFLRNKTQWHLIGHLQKNKVKKAVRIFDMIETLDSLALAEALDTECKKIGKIMSVLIEVNSAQEFQKQGLLAENVEPFLKQILKYTNLKPMGLMTMGPWRDNPEELRPYFKKTKALFDKIKAGYGKKIEWVYLSMGMSTTYRIAIEEGANLVRVGTAIFGERL